jgi:hypothetical protein
MNKYITSYENYFTYDPLLEPINEGRGIPEDLKSVINEVYNSIIDFIENGKKINLFSFSYEKFKIKNLRINLNIDNSRKDIYATSQFGKFNGKELENPIINLITNLDLSNLKVVITHELLHIYEIYNRIIKINKNNYDIQWYNANILYKIRNKYNDDFIKYFIYLIYLSFNQEINARVAQTYTYLMELNKLKTYSKDELFLELKKSNAWKYSEELLNFDFNNKKIDFNLLKKFLVEYNTEINKKIVKKFNINKIPDTNKDCLDILKSYKKLFKKKGYYFQHKLEIIVDEVILDTLLYNRAFRTFENGIIKVIFDKKLLRESKIYKLLR